MMIDVLMPAYNSEAFIHEAISSMLNQTYENFRLLVFNDGSSDNTQEILRTFKDKRILYFESEQNIGCANALNALLQSADAKYIARMDADDISLPNRLEVQINFMESNPDLVLCGAGLRVFHGEETETTVYYPENSEEIRVNLLAYNCIGHPTVFFRNGLFRYDNQYEYAEDYHAWATLSKNKKNLMANIPEVLLRYRLHPQQASARKSNEQFTVANEIKKQLLNNLSRRFTFREVNIFLSLMNAHSENFPFNLAETEDLIQKILMVNHARQVYSSPFLEEHLKHYLKVVVQKFEI
jgi:glycosyltransferase involved in cell wall biosynthesis